MIHTKKIFLCFYLIVLVNPYIQSDSNGIVDTLEKAGKKLVQPTELLLVNVVQERKKQLEEIQKELKTLTDEEKSFEHDIKKNLDEITAQRDLAQVALKKNPDDDYLKKRLSLLNEIYQMLKDIQRVRERLVELDMTLIRQLNDFLADPDFEVFKKEKKLLESRYYAFEDLVKAHEEILEQEKRVNQLAEQEKATLTEFEGRKRSSAATSELYKKKQEEYQTVMGTGVSLDDAGRKDVDQILTQLRLEQELYNHKKMFDELRLAEINRKITHIGIQLLIARRHLDLLKKHIEKIKPFIRVSEADVIAAKDELEEAKQEYYRIKESYRKDMDLLQDRDRKQLAQLEALSAQYEIQLGRDLDKWTREPKKTVAGYQELYEVGLANSMHQLFNQKQEILDAQIALEDEKNNYRTLLVQVKESYHKITIRKFLSEDDIKQETIKYDAPRAETKASIAVYKEKVGVVTDQLSTKKRVLDTIRAQRDELKKQRDELFSRDKGAYLRCIELLNQAEDTVKDQIDILGKLTGVYSAIISQLNRSSQLIDIIKGELAVGSIWYRTEDTIKWQEIKDIVPDVMNFFSDVRSYIARFNIWHVKYVFKNWIDLLLLSIQLAIVLFTLLILRAYAPYLSHMLKQSAQVKRGLAHFMSLFGAVLLDFYRTYFFGIALWLLFFSCFFLHDIPDLYLYILFYLGSIPYLLYLSRQFIQFFIQQNSAYEYAFLAPDFQRRFVLVFSILLYASITIFFFREAFMLANYRKSDLPTILLAINFIVFQISLIFLIAKEQILNIIPQRNEVWLWVRERVDRFYYLLLLLVIAIIVMSNPYVGFGRLVLHILVGLVYTMLLMFGLVWVHGLFKRIASRVFFFTDEEVVRERFVHAKTWFGLLIIASFISICFIGFIIGVNIWGWLWDWYVGMQEVYSWLITPILQKETAHPISVLSIFQLIGFIFIGFFVSYALNKYVLDKIFDLLLVDTGVQNTVTRITRYIIVTIAIFFGLQSVGLGQFVTFIVGGLVLSLGWVLKEPISDFIAYFIILVQRPVKIGDYIQIDKEVMGIVRKITPRSVVLRRKNSTTIIVPNASVINKSIVNWNYARNFLAFDDIIVTVNYDADPMQVKDILYTIVQSHPSVLRNPKPMIRLDNFGEYGFVFMVRGFISSVYTLEQWEIASDIRIAIVQTLRKENIKLALPIRILVNKHNNNLDVLQQPIKE